MCFCEKRKGKRAAISSDRTSYVVRIPCLLPKTVRHWPGVVCNIGNESVPIYLAQCWFPGLASSNAKNINLFLNETYTESNFCQSIKLYSETVIVWNYQSVDCSLENKFIVSLIIFGTLSSHIGIHFHSPTSTICNATTASIRPPARYMPPSTLLSAASSRWRHRDVNEHLRQQHPSAQCAISHCQSSRDVMTIHVVTRRFTLNTEISVNWSEMNSAIIVKSSAKRAYVQKLSAALGARQPHRA